MALPSSGSLTLSQIQAEFGRGGSNPISLSEYYRGGSYVSNIAANNNIPTSGTISISNFYGGQGVITVTLNSSGNFFNYNLATVLTQVIGWNQVTPIDVTLNIAGGSFIKNSGGYAAMPYGAAFVVPNFPNGSKVTINNSGYIVGAGGLPFWLSPPSGHVDRATSGGHAFVVQFSNTVINNYGYIVGGGGAGGHPSQDLRSSGGIDPVTGTSLIDNRGGHGGWALIIVPPDFRIAWPVISNYGGIFGGGGGGGGGQYQGVISSCAPPGGGEAGYEVRAPGGGGGAGQSYEPAYGGYYAFGRSACSADGGGNGSFGGLGGNSSNFSAPGVGGNGTIRYGANGAVAYGGAGGNGGSFGDPGGNGGTGSGGLYGTDGGYAGYAKVELSPSASTTAVRGDTRGGWVVF
jgi:hypothetical protein